MDAIIHVTTDESPGERREREREREREKSQRKCINLYITVIALSEIISVVAGVPVSAKPIYQLQLSVLCLSFAHLTEALRDS